MSAYNKRGCEEGVCCGDSKFGKSKFGKRRGLPNFGGKFGKIEQIMRYQIYCKFGKLYLIRGQKGVSQLPNLVFTKFATRAIAERNFVRGVNLVIFLPNLGKFGDIWFTVKVKLQPPPVTSPVSCYVETK